MREGTRKVIIGAGIAAGAGGAATEMVLGVPWAAAIIIIACLAWLRIVSVRGWSMLPVLRFRLQLWWRLDAAGRLLPFVGRPPRPEPHKSTLPDPAPNQED